MIEENEQLRSHVEEVQKKVVVYLGNIEKLNSQAENISKEKESVVS